MTGDKTLNPTIDAVTQRIRKKSQPTRSRYLAQIQAARHKQPERNQLSCTNFAHAVAAASSDEKFILHQQRAPNLAIVSAYNDMLSAHQPFDRFPPIIKKAAREAGATAQFAGGVPAMCDGVTQGRDGMELSLFSRDVIAMSTALALSHDMFDAVVCLGTCDKIVPGLLMGVLGFGHLPVIFAPAGPMTSGLSNAEKAAARQQFASGEISREALLEKECESYHGPGTCTFYGTANSNQMLLDLMGLQLPGSSFINPGEAIRDHLTAAATTQVLKLTSTGENYTPIGELVDERCIVNAIVGLLATGGSTNHTIHLIAIARCAGIVIDWNDLSELSTVVPTLTRVYPNGSADINQFHAAGGMPLVTRELLALELLHADVATVAGNDGLHGYCTEPVHEDNTLKWREGAVRSADEQIIASASQPFSKSGGLALLQGNLGRAVIKISAVKKEHWKIEAPALVFSNQADFLNAFQAGELEKDFVAVVINQGPKSNGMPELHKLTPALGLLQDRGFKVALVTDGRMSGASGKVAAAIHVSPECADEGPLGKVRNGDIICLDAERGQLAALVEESEWQQRQCIQPSTSDQTVGTGREFFAGFRQAVSTAETGAVTFFGNQTADSTAAAGSTTA